MGFEDEQMIAGLIIFYGLLIWITLVSEADEPRR